MTKLNQPMAGNTFILSQANCVWMIDLYGLSKTLQHLRQAKPENVGGSMN